jgi:hypothetical protein
VAEAEAALPSPAFLRRPGRRDSRGASWAGAGRVVEAPAVARGAGATSTGAAAWPWRGGRGPRHAAARAVPGSHSMRPPSEWQWRLEAEGGSPVPFSHSGSLEHQNVSPTWACALVTSLYSCLSWGGGRRPWAKHVGSEYASSNPSGALGGRTQRDVDPHNKHTHAMHTGSDTRQPCPSQSGAREPAGTEWRCRHGCPTPQRPRAQCAPTGCETAWRPPSTPRPSFWESCTCERRNTGLRTRVTEQSVPPLAPWGEHGRRCKGA